MNNLILLISGYVVEIHSPVGGPDSVATCMEFAEKSCREAAQISACDTPESRLMYEDWLATVRQEQYLKGLKRLIHKHVLHLKLYEIVLKQDVSDHPGMWRSLRAAFLSQASILRQSMHSFPGENTSQ